MTPPSDLLRWKSTLVSLVAASLIFGMAGTVGWYTIRERVAQQPEYQLQSQHIVVPAPPPWIPNDFVEHVLYRSGLGSANFSENNSLLDKSLPHKIAQAFAADPWVEEVRRVELHFPSGATVDLIYRKPIAFVELANGGSLLPIDRNGVLLPQDFLLLPREKWPALLRIQGSFSTPLHNAGMPWDDPQIHEAAKLADALIETLGTVFSTPQGTATLYKTVPPGQVSLWMIRTSGNVEIILGAVDEDISVKLERLQRMIQRYGKLENVPAALRPIDLRLQ